MNKILGIAAVLMTAIFAVNVLAGEGGTAGVTASVAIPATCGIVTNPTTLDFGSVPTGGNSEKTTDVTNQGSVSANVDIKGTDWENAGKTLSFGVGNTKFGTATDPATALASTDKDFTDISNGATQKAYLKMSVPLGQATATYGQTITFTATC